MTSRPLGVGALGGGHSRSSQTSGTSAGALGVSVRRDRRKRTLFPLGLVVGVLVGGTVVARRLGYKVGGNTVVRCRDGHLFTTFWIPGASLKAIRLGWYRFQRCPVGNHWSLVRPVKDADLTDEEREAAERFHDLRLP
ncbi:MAG TPA: hypothetical protein VGZ32_18480 [Actinocrinis sp.]|uniref:hypothetical protein n=1 Tax=Actinocrinis sp. TaxID=1920516 RepID=UPI002DDD0C83|nr:hypothetical protein [Actinocrinis sp.]HEV3172340.1 hypothetical protein [Actinocrinis sp.]